jgi:flagellar protein FliS
MPEDEVRARYLRDRVMTATPAQRVVMIYDRLGLDITLAQSAGEPFAAGQHLAHAMQVVAELQSSLDATAGGPAENLGSIYTYLLTEIVAARGGETERLPAVAEIVATLRAAWAEATELVAAAPSSLPHAAGAWVG